MSINRYKFTKVGVAKAIEFLQSGKDHLSLPAWVEKFKGKLNLKGGKLYFEDREIIAREDVRTYLKKYKNLLAGRDCAHQELLKETVGITKRMVSDYLKSVKERAVTDCDPTKNYQFTISKQELVVCNPRFEKKYKQSQCVVFCQPGTSGTTLTLSPTVPSESYKTVTDLQMPSGSVRETIFTILKERRALTIKNALKKAQCILNKKTG